MVADEGIDLSRYQALIMDTQGSELLVLKGAGRLIENFRYIKTEAADFEAYKGCCLVGDLTSYLAHFGFVEIARNPFAQRGAGGRYYDLTFERQAE